MQALRSVLALMLAAGAILGSTESIRAQQNQLDYAEFEQKLSQFVRLENEKRLEELVKRNPGHALGYQENLCRTIRNGVENEANARIRDMVEQAFGRAFDSPTPIRKVREWAETGTAEQFQAFSQAQSGFRQAYAAVTAMDNNDKATRSDWEGIHESIRNVARAFESSGEMIKAAEAWSYALTVRASKFRPQQKSDLEEQLVDINEFLEAREAWYFTEDVTYVRNKNYRQELVAKIEEGNSKPEEGEDEEESTGDRSRFLSSEGGTAQGEIGSAKKLYESMGFQNGTRPTEWLSISIQGPGPSKLWQIEEPNFFLVRPKGESLGITLDGETRDLDENEWVEVDASNRVKSPSKFELDGESYAAWFFLGGTQQTRYGIQMNLAPSAELMTVFYRSAMEWTFEVNGTEVVIQDDNTDFRFGLEEVSERVVNDRHVGEKPMQAVDVPSVDGMRIDGGPLQPFSNWLKIEDDWYYIEQNGKSSIGWTKAESGAFETGEIVLDWNGNKKNAPTALLIRGSSEFSNAVFDISSQKPVQVPAGNYTLLYGHIVSGKGDRAMSARITAGEMESFEVRPGEKIELSLGGTFRLDYERDVQDQDVQIHAASLRIRGIAGEIYTHLEGGIVPEIEVLTAKDAEGRGARPVGEFKPLQSAEQSNAFAGTMTDLGVETGYYPVPDTDGDISAALTVEGGAAKLIGLRQKKNKLFGKLEPIWK
ncbi:MAG: hypothetical protein AAF196_10640 [Planctomycetota bacterium]